MDSLSRTEWFTEEDFPAALARLDELGAANPVDPRHPRAENRASRRLAQIVDLAHARDRAGSRALLTDDFVRLDRRRGVAAWDAHGPDEWVAALDAWFDVGMERLSVEPIAVRGEQLVLARVQLSNAAGAVVPFLGVWETDGSGHFVRAVHFDDDALAEAIEELDARYLAGEGAELAGIVRPSLHHLAAINRRDWDTLVVTMRPDIVIGDHRGLWPPTSDRAAYLARMQSLAVTAPDSTVVGRKLHVVRSAFLVTCDVQGTSEHGERYEYSFHITATVVDGLSAGFEFFADDDFTAAARPPRRARRRATG